MNRIRKGEGALQDWAVYQRSVAEFFESLGMEALVDHRVRGVRTTHDIDVLVRATYVGFDITWVVECKAWRSRVPKEKVLALRQIVDDVGADRGFLLAESGYQSGALEAALVSNVTLTSVADLTERLSYDLAMTKLVKLEPRADEAKRRYWNLSKQTRIAAHLRPDVGVPGYSSTKVLAGVDQLLREVRLHGFPLVYSPFAAALTPSSHCYKPLGGPDDVVIDDPEALFALLDGQLCEVEARLEAAEKIAQT